VIEAALWIAALAGFTAALVPVGIGSTRDPGHRQLHAVQALAGDQRQAPA
jgi:hypothetical protein